MKTFRVFSSVASIKKYAQKPKEPVVQPPDFSMPRPHAIKMNEISAEVISYKIPNRPLSALGEVPLEARLRVFPYFTSPENSRVVNVGIIGAPNAGKTSLLNSLMGNRYFSVSRKVNTTQDTQEGIKVIENTQIIFHDTPGIISTHQERTNSISSKGWEVLDECDIALFVVDGVKILKNDVKAACNRLQKNFADRGIRTMPEAKIVGESEEQYQQRLSLAPVTIPACLVVNKVDLVEDRRKVKYLVSELNDYAKFMKNFFVSAEKNYNVSELLDWVVSQSKPDRWRYHPLQRTTTSDVSIAEDIVREQVLAWIHDELPYRWAYRTIGWTPFLDGSLRIEMDILVMSHIHIGILLGKESKNIKKIWFESQNILSKMYNRKVNLVLKAKLMKSEIKRAVHKGKTVEITHPHLAHTETIAPESLKEIESAKSDN